jgi:hypothetical protein
MPKTYTLPFESVRIVQPSGCWLMPLSVAGPTCDVVQETPPSVDRDTMSGVGRAFPCELLRNDAQHTYTEPKCGLLSALSAQICDLSENVVDDCFETRTGSDHADALFAAAARTSSVRETAIASAPLNDWSLRVAPKFDVRFE